MEDGGWSVRLGGGGCFPFFSFCFCFFCDGE